MNERLSLRLLSAAHAVLWVQAALLAGGGAAMVAFGFRETGAGATGAESRVGVAMMFLAIYPLLLAVAAVALAGAVRERRTGTRAWAAGFEAFLLLLTGPFVNYPYPAVAALGLCSVAAAAFVLAVVARPGAAAQFTGRTDGTLRAAD